MIGRVGDEGVAAEDREAEGLLGDLCWLAGRGRPGSGAAAATASGEVTATWGRARLTRRAAGPTARHHRIPTRPRLFMRIPRASTTPAASYLELSRLTAEGPGRWVASGRASPGRARPPRWPSRLGHQTGWPRSPAASAGPARRDTAPESEIGRRRWR